MADLAKVGFSVDTSGLEKGKAAMEALAPAAEKVEAAANKVEASTKKAGAAVFDWGDNLNTSGIAIKKVTAAAQGEATTVAKLTTVVTGNTTATIANTAANQNNAASMVASGAAANTAGGATAGAVGRLSTVTNVLGTVGRGVFAELAAGLAAIVSPANLVFFAITTLANIVAGYFNTWFQSADQVEADLQEQAALIQRVAAAWGEAIPQIAAYNSELQRQKEIQDLMAAGQTLNADNLEKIRQGFADIAPEAERFISQLSFENVDNTKITDLQTAFETLQEKVAAGTSTQEDFNSVLSAAQAASASGVSGLEGFISTLGALIGRVGPAIAAVTALNQAIANAASNANNPAMWRSAGMTGQSAEGPIQGSGQMLPETGPVPGSRGTPELSGFPWEKFGASAKGKGAGGGGGAAKETLTALQKLNEEFTKLSAPFNQAKTAYGTLETAMKNGVITNDQYAASLKDIEAAFMAAGGTSEQWANVLASNTKKASDGVTELASITKGFVSDLRSGLADGESFFEAFANAGLNAADKLIDKGLNAIIDKLFEVGSASSALGGKGGSGGGILGGIGKFITGLFSAKGNVFDGGVKAFAKGGSFTNSIVSKPTAFAFGKGDTMGVMGEAGPEAIMPLKRGPNGSLGVQMHGANGGGQKQAANVNLKAGDNYFTIAGAVSEASLVAQIKATAEKTKNDTKKQMVGWLNEYQRNGVMSTTE